MSTFLQLKGRLNDVVHGQKNVTAWQLEMGALLNDAYIHVVSQLRCYTKTTAPLTLTAADGDYSIVSDLLVADFSTLRVVRYTAANGSSTLNTLAPSTPDEVTALRSANPSATTPATTYALSGWDGLMLHPLPATGDTLTLIYDAVPVAMIADGDSPTRLPQEWHHLISTRAAATAMEYFEPTLADNLMQKYKRELSDARLWFNQRVGSRGFAPNVNTNRGLILWPGDYFSSV